jgi:DNA-binding response OmpR family regulator
MIAIVSSAAPESAAFGSLFDQNGWNHVECRSVRAFKRVVRRVPLRVVLVRYQLHDGFSNDVITEVTGPGLSFHAKIIVLLSAGIPSSIEARQLEMGADCVQRDPVRSDVLLAYIAKYIQSAPKSPALVPMKQVDFSSATLNPLDRSLQRGDKAILLTPREAMLVELLAGSAGQVVTYEVLYNEILGRKFQGDTSNMRVLLGKLGISARRIGISIRSIVDVIPKTGYRYRRPSQSSLVELHSDTPPTSALPGEHL